ncbi:GNAT family N-acetyltransferase [Calidifontibacter terrae]
MTSTCGFSASTEPSSAGCSDCTREWCSHAETHVPDPGHRGRGHGRQLLNVAIATAAHDGCQQIILDTSDRQHDAIRLYEGAGFNLHHTSGITRYYTLDLSRP